MTAESVVQLRVHGVSGTPPAAMLHYPTERHPDTAARRAFGDDVLSFNSWRGLEAHRPLGSINRLKKLVYEA